jgi:diguanylate cyclase (GGDEF)-like protein
VANERLERLSVTDPLTGLANRRRLADVLDSEWWRAVRPAQSMAIAVIDVDHFSAYNEIYGRLAGDRCLQRVAAAVSECVRTMDLVARYDGEAFAIVLPTVDGEVGQLIAERIRDAVIALEEPHERSPFGFVTVSVGVVAEVPSWDGSPQALLAEADHRRTEAKRRGRNLVVAG